MAELIKTGDLLPIDGGTPNRPLNPVDVDPVNPDNGSRSEPDTGNSSSLTDEQLQRLIDAFRSVIEHAVINAGGSVSPPTDIGIWQGDPTKDAEGNLLDLQNWLAALFTNGSSYFNDSALFNGASFLNLLKMSLKGLRTWVDDNSGWWYGNDYKWSLFEKLLGYTQQYMDTIFTQALNYQSWYLQQDYNSPLNQLKRLEQAGLCSAFLFQGYSSGNAQSAAAVTPGQAGQMTNAGELALQRQLGNAQNEVARQEASIHSQEATTALLEHGVNSIKTLAEAENIRLLTPVQVASAIRQYQNQGITFDYLSHQVSQIENDMAIKMFNADREAFNFDVEAADKRVKQYEQELAIASSDNFAMAMNSRLIETETYSGYVKTRSGQIIRKDYTIDQLEYAWLHEGIDEFGNTVFSEEDRKTAKKGSVKAGVKFPSVGVDVGAAGEIASEKAHKKGDTDSKKHNQKESTSDSFASSTGHYDETQRTLTIGSQKFARTITRKMMKSQEYIDYMDKLKSDLVKAKDDYFMLTTGERSRAFLNLDLYIKNKAEGIKWNILRNYGRALYDMSVPPSSGQ